MAKRRQPVNEYQSPRNRQSEDTGIIWSILGVLSLIGALIIFVGASIPTWRLSEAIEYHYIKSVTLRVISFKPTTYGLYLISFNGGTVKNWYRLQSQICSGVLSIATIGSVSNLVSGTACNSICINHFQTRCQVYTKLQFWGFLTLGVLIVCGCLGLLATAWIFVFGVNRMVLQLLWICGGLGALLAIATWTLISDNGFSSLSLESQFPYPSLSTGAYLAVSGASSLLFCGVIAFLAAVLADRAEWNQRQDEIQRRILGDTAVDGYRGPGGGLMMGMPNPNAFRPPFPPGGYSGANSLPGGGSIPAGRGQVPFPVQHRGFAGAGGPPSRMGGLGGLPSPAPPPSSFGLGRPPGFR